MNVQRAALVLAGLAAFGLSGCAPSAPADTSAAAPSEAADAPANQPGPQDADAPTEFTTTESGLKYRVLRKGAEQLPTETNLVTVNYKGWLDDGKEFDSSYTRGVPFPVDMAGGVIPGWLEGLRYVGEGGMIELEIPPDLGYGEDGAPGAIPPNATLHFLVEVIRVD